MIVDLIKGKNFRISQVNESEVTVEVSSGSGLSSTTISGESQATTPLYSACDEAIPLYNGKILKRIRDRVFIEENEN